MSGCLQNSTPTVLQQCQNQIKTQKIQNNVKTIIYLVLKLDSKYIFRKEPKLNLEKLIKERIVKLKYLNYKIQNEINFLSIE